MNSRKELKWRQKYNFKNSLKNIIDFYDLTQSKINSKDFKKFI
jgi:dTDP-D-glucose 4,6-dehydratase